MIDRQKYTRDDFLGGAVKLFQPISGYRIATDTVFLAASLSFCAGDHMLDMGAGSGGILNCLLSRKKKHVSGNIFHGIEMQQELLDLARINARENNFGDAIEYFHGSVSAPPPDCAPNSYHHVVSNPPYYRKDAGPVSLHDSKARAHMDGEITLAQWVGHCLRMTRPLGHITLIHRADRLDDIIAALHGKAGDIIIYPLWSTCDKDANRVIIRARKGAKGILALKSGLIVHKSDGTFTAQAENILRQGAALDITN